MNHRLHRFKKKSVRIRGICGNPKSGFKVKKNFSTAKSQLFIKFGALWAVFLVNNLNSRSFFDLP